jgi:hypothetical protein
VGLDHIGNEEEADERIQEQAGGGSDGERKRTEEPTHATSNPLMTNIRAKL